MNGVDDHIKDMISDIQMFTSSISEYGTHTITRQVSQSPLTFRRYGRAYFRMNESRQMAE